MTTRRVLAALLALVLAVVVTACGGDDAASTTTVDPAAPPPAVDEDDPLAGRTFTGGRIEVDDQPVDVPGGGQLVIEFTGAEDAGNGTVRASAGCNDLSAGYTIAPEGLMTNGFITTELGCDEDQHAFDQLIGDILRSPTYQLDDDALTLISVGDSGRLTAVLTDES